MKRVAPLRYGVIFKKAFCDPEIFTAFAKAVLGIEIEVDKVETEKAFHPPIGKVDCRYDLFAEDKKNRLVVDIQHDRSSDHYHRFMYYHIMAVAEQVAKAENYRPKLEVYTIVVLTGYDKNQADMSWVDFNPVTRKGKYTGEIAHKIIYLAPRYVEDDTPEPLRQWLLAIEDTLDQEVDESTYTDPNILRVFDEIKDDLLSPAERAKMLEENIQEELRQTQFDLGVQKGAYEHALETARAMLLDEAPIALIQKYTKLTEAEIRVIQSELAQTSATK